MANWIYSRTIQDKLQIEGKTFMRKIDMHYNDNKYKITWYYYNQGFRIIRSPTQFNKLEFLYQTKKDR